MSCGCRDCAGDGAAQRLLRAFDDPARGGEWYTTVFGAAPGDLRRDLRARLADDGEAHRLVARLGVEAAVPLAILAEAPAGIPLATLVYETVALIGSAAQQAIERVAGLMFESRAYDYRFYARGQPLFLLPAPLAHWLRPAVAGVLRAGDPPPPPSQASATPAADLGWREVMALAAVATVRPRVTSGRLFKKDQERLVALLAPAGLGEPMEVTIERLRALRLLRLVFEDAGRLEPRWRAASAWAEQPASERLRQRLALMHRTSTVWPVLAAAGGAWVDEVHLARQFRLARQIAPEPGPTPSIRERGWVLERDRTLATWPEVERTVHGGHPFWRIRPALAAAVDRAAGGRAHVQPDFEIVAPPEMALTDLLFLARVADLRRPDVVATFALTSGSARRAAGQGVTATTICAGLAALAAHGVPPALARAIRDWTGDIGRCTVRSVALVTFDDTALADRAAAVLGPDAERVSPVCFAVPEGKAADKLDKQLADAGMAARDRGGAADAEEDDDDLDQEDQPPAPPPPAQPVLAASLDPGWVATLRDLRAVRAAFLPLDGPRSDAE
jgi:hypothetical protein